MRLGRQILSRSTSTLVSLKPGMQLVYGGDRVFTVTQQLADDFKAGDSLLIVENTGQPLLIPQAQKHLASTAISTAATAFTELAKIPDEAISNFYEHFAQKLECQQTWSEISAANSADVSKAQHLGKSTTRLAVSEKMRKDMIDGLRGWINAPSVRGKVMERVVHPKWEVELVGAELGIVGFVFEGRPNVLADATGVLRGGNTIVYRIGSDALGTARTIMKAAVSPALQQAGLPQGAISLVDSTHHAAGWALFSDSRLSLAVARGSGHAVSTLGSLAQRAGIPVSLHGTGGAWMVVSPKADPETFFGAVVGSLDRKVCNTLNVVCIPREKAAELSTNFLSALEAAAAKRKHPFKLHVVKGSEDFFPAELFSKKVAIRRGGEVRTENQAEVLFEEDLAHEWEWEESPEVTVKVVENVEEGILLCNCYSPQFVASVITPDPAEFQAFYQRVNAPFVGNGFTRWVDGQFALNKPELGLANWQYGRLFGRPGILSGDSVFTVRCRATQHVKELAR